MPCTRIQGSLTPLEHSARLKSSLTPLKRLDGFIQEQKVRREEFRARHRQRAAQAATLEELHRAPSKPVDSKEGKKKESYRHWNPTNCVELELHALRAIRCVGMPYSCAVQTSELYKETQKCKREKVMYKCLDFGHSSPYSARQDAIQKLAAGCSKVDAHIQLRFGLVLSNDPVLRMFFRLVENVREKTIDAVECAASWERNVGRGQPFLYKYVRHKDAMISWTIAVYLIVRCCLQPSLLLNLCD